MRPISGRLSAGLVASKLSDSPSTGLHVDHSVRCLRQHCLMHKKPIGPELHSSKPRFYPFRCCSLGRLAPSNKRTPAHTSFSSSSPQPRTTFSPITTLPKPSDLGNEIANVLNLVPERRRIGVVMAPSKSKPLVMAFEDNGCVYLPQPHSGYDLICA